MDEKQDTNTHNNNSINQSQNYQNNEATSINSIQQQNNQNTFQQDTQQTTDTVYQVSVGSNNINSDVKNKPPIAAQILYALGFLGLIFGLLGSVIILFSSSNVGGTLGRFGSITGVFLAVLTIFGFYLIHEIRYGKKWSLIAYTTLFVLGTLSVVYDLLLGTNSDASFIISFVIVGPILLTLWTRNRSYFS